MLPHHVYYWQFIYVLFPLNVCFPVTCKHFLPRMLNYCCQQYQLMLPEYILCTKAYTKHSYTLTLCTLTMTPEVGTITTLILQREKLRHRELKNLVALTSVAQMVGASPRTPNGGSQ